MARPSRSIATGKAALRRLVVILQRDQKSLERTQRCERRQENQRAPQQRVNPVWRGIKDFHPQCPPGDKEAGKKNHEKSPSAAGHSNTKNSAHPLPTRR